MVPTDEAMITPQIFDVEIWSDDVTCMGTLAIETALLEGNQSRPDLIPVFS